MSEMKIENHFAQGAIVNNGQMNVGGGTIHVHVQGNGPAVVEEVDEALAGKLAPVFFGNRELVAEFLGRIKGAKPTDVTAEVNRLIKERKVSDISCNKVLWEILHENGYYAPTLSNWNSQIR